MRIIKSGRVREFARQHAGAGPALDRWLVLTEAGRWSSLADLRRTFSHADEVKVASGRTVVIFNIKGNAFRLVTAIHYNRGLVFVLLFMTHAEYSKNTWKDLL